MAPCFRFLMKTVLITHGGFSCHRAVLHRAKNVSASCAVSPVRGLGMHKELVGDKGYCTSCGIMLSNKS